MNHQDSRSVTTKTFSPTALALFLGLALAFPGSAALATNDPIPGVDIIVKKNPGGIAVVVPIDDSGKFSLRLKEPGNHTISTVCRQPSGCLPHNLSATLKPGAEGEPSIIAILIGLLLPAQKASVGGTSFNFTVGDRGVVLSGQIPISGVSVAASAAGVRVAAGDVNGDGVEARKAGEPIKGGGPRPPPIVVPGTLALTEANVEGRIVNGFGGTGGGRFTFKPTLPVADPANAASSNRDHIDQDAQTDIRKKTAVQSGVPGNARIRISADVSTIRVQNYGIKATETAPGTDGGGVKPGIMPAYSNFDRDPGPVDIAATTDAQTDIKKRTTVQPDVPGNARRVTDFGPDGENGERAGKHNYKGVVTLVKGVAPRPGGEDDVPEARTLEVTVTPVNDAPSKVGNTIPEPVGPPVKVQLRNVDTGALAGTTVVATGANFPDKDGLAGTTLRKGEFTFSLPVGNYVVEIVDATGKLIGTSASIAVSSGGTVMRSSDGKMMIFDRWGNFIATPITVEDEKFKANNKVTNDREKRSIAATADQPIAGLNVKLGKNPGGSIEVNATVNSSGTIVAAEAIASSRTDSQGNFHFEQLPAGNYVLILPDLPSQSLTVGADGIARGTVMRGPDGSMRIFNRWGNAFTAPLHKAGAAKQDTPDQTSKAAESPVSFGSGNHTMGAGMGLGAGPGMSHPGAGPGAGPGMSLPGTAMGGAGGPGPVSPMGAGPMGGGPGGAMRP